MHGIGCGVTFEQWHKARGRGARAELHRATGLSYETLRKVEERQPIRRDSAYTLATFLQCDEELFVSPKPKRKRAPR